jgi:hypothetical protein
MSVQESFAALRQTVSDLETSGDVEKAATGNGAAGTRVRKAMQTAKVQAQAVRTLVTEAVKAKKAAKA